MWNDNVKDFCVIDNGTYIPRNTEWTPLQIML